MKTLSDEELIRLIRGTEEERRLALKTFFMDARLEKMVFAKIRERGGALQDAQDAYQEAFKIFQRNIRDGSFENRGSLRSYFVGISLRLFEDLRKRSWNKRVNLTEDTAQLDRQSLDSPLEQTEETERRTLVRQLLAKLAERCREILWLRANSHTMEEIARKTGLSSAEMAKKEAYRCNNRLKELVFSRPELLHLVKSLIHE